MNAKLILLAATMVGALGGYAWSAFAPAAPAKESSQVAAAPPASTPAIASIEPRSTASVEDREWSGRGSASSTGAAAGQRRAVEQSFIYSGCNQVRALGKAPLYAGQPGYRSEMDGDGDGIACEPIRIR